MSDWFKTGARPRPYGAAMTARFEAIGLVVADMGKSLAFYRRLGLDLPAAADAEPHVDLELTPGIRLLWDTAENVRSFDPTWSPPSGGARMGLAFGCDSPADVDRLYTELINAGYEGHLAPWDAFWGQRYASVRDPDGNGVDLFAPLEG
jgi:catechol 2,3-dioxygenase-like lactoylglutathione lyase family enzyme